MNKLFIPILAGFALFLFSSCQTETSPTPVTNSIDTTLSFEITGEWNFDSLYHRDGKQTVNGTVYQTYTSTTENEVGGLNLSIDNQYTYNISFDETLVWNKSGELSTDYSPDIIIDRSGDYVYESDSNTLIMKVGSYSDVYSVETLSDKQLIISKPWAHTYYDQSTGYTWETTTEIVYIFTR